MVARSPYVDWIVRFDNQLLQIQKSNANQVRPKQKIVLKKHLNGRITLWSKGQKIPYCFTDKPIKEEKIKLGHDLVKCSQNARKNKSKTPWSQFNPGWLKQTREHLEAVS